MRNDACGILTVAKDLHNGDSGYEHKK